MSILASIISPAGSSVIGAVGKIIDDCVTTDEERAAADLLKAKLAAEPHKAQVEINKLEAQHRSLFVAGWRPFIGWVCGMGLAWHFLGGPIAEYVTDAPLPEFDTGALISLVISLLGLGGLRTFEKFGGRTK